MEIDGTNRCSVFVTPVELAHDLGTFKGFSYLDVDAIHPDQTAQQVANWEHDAWGEAEFIPAGDHPGVALLFEDRQNVERNELLALDKLLTAVGDDSMFTFVRIYALVRGAGIPLLELNPKDLEDYRSHIFTGGSFLELKKKAAYTLFELYYPDDYKAWEQSNCPGLGLDVGEFLGSLGLWRSQLTYGDENVLLVDGWRPGGGRDGHILPACPLPSPTRP